MKIGSKMRKLSLFLLAPCLISCSKGSDRPVVESAVPDRKAEAVGAYADTLMSFHRDLLLGHSVPKQTLATPLVTYLVTFTVKRPAWLSEPLRSPDDQATRDRNLDVTAAWERLFCTTELVTLLRENQIAVLSGMLVDEQGRNHSVAACTRSSTAKSIEDPSRINAAASGSSAQ